MRKNEQPCSPPLSAVPPESLLGAAQITGDRGQIRKFWVNLRRYDKGNPACRPVGTEQFRRRRHPDRIVEFSDAASLRDYLAAHEDIRQGKLGVLGGGNNILFTEDFHGTLLHPAGEGFSVTGSSGNSVSVRAEAGLDWEKFVERCIGLGLWGTENLTAIPGTVGAAPVQNIGAYGAEAKDIVESVETLDLATLKEVSIAGCHCGFGYRDSIFKGVLKGRAVITAVTFRLSRTPRPNLGYDALAREVEDAGGATLENIRTAVRRIRGEKLPDPAVTGNAGSFFKNPVVDSELAERIKRKYPDMPSYPVPEGVKIPAGWLIEKTGWKGASLGRAGVYGKQALILVNLGGATGNEVTALARRITDDVETRFGIRIATEVNIW